MCFFIPGYDPNAPRRYRELYRREAARQAAVSGYDIEVKRMGDAPNFSWGVRGRFGDDRIETVIELLTWEDIVRKSMSRSIPVTYWVMLRTMWVYAVSGAFVRLVRLRWTPMLVAVYPVLALMVQAALAVLAGCVVMKGTGWLGLGAVAGWTAVGLAAWAVLEVFRRADRRYYAYYLIHDYGFNASEGGRIPKALRGRIDEFAARISAALKSGVDEVLVVGHSTGAQLAVLATVGCLEAERAQATRLSLLTLGQVIPMQSFLPRAQGLRRDLARLSEAEGLTWVDVSAPGDGACFALSDPVAVSGVAGPDQKWPLVLSGAFHNTLSDEEYRATKWKFFRRHIQYLCAFDRPGDYDYFAITGGPVALADRFAGRLSSPSRISRVLSRYTDTG